MVNRTGTPLVELRDISISFGGIKAVDHVTVDLFPGEVVGLLGHNGAGKSTLIKCLSGAYQKDSGQILINGQEVASYSKAELVGAGKLKSTDGVVGVRMGHNTDAHLAGFALTKN